jgi:hypothetical protein
VTNWPPRDSQPYNPPLAGYHVPGHQPPPMPPQPGAASWWKRLPDGGKVALLFVAVLVLCCGGATMIGGLASSAKKDNRSSVGEAPAAARYSAVAASTGASPSASPSTASAPSTAPASPTVEKRTVTETRSVPFGTRRVNDSTLAQGQTRVRTKGVTGLKTVTSEVVLTNGVQTSKTVISEQVTKQPVTEVIAVGTKKASSCDPNYSGCVPIASDVDCAGGSGNGPAYVQGPVTVIGRDIYGLDADHDGIGCED